MHRKRSLPPLLVLTEDQAGVPRPKHRALTWLPREATPTAAHERAEPPRRAAA